MDTLTSGGSRGSLTVVDVSNPAYPHIVGWITSAWVHGVCRGLTCWQCFGYTILPLTCILIPPAQAQTVRVVGSYAYVGTIWDYGKRLVVVDVSNVAYLSVIGELYLGTMVADLQVSGSYAYASLTVGGSYENSITVVDISDPTSLSVVGFTHLIGDEPGRLHLEGSYVYTVSYASGTLWIADISNPTAPTIRGSVSSVFMRKVHHDLPYFACAPL